MNWKKPFHLGLIGTVAATAACGGGGDSSNDKSFSNTVMLYSSMQEVG